MAETRWGGRGGLLHLLLKLGDLGLSSGGAGFLVGLDGLLAQRLGFLLALLLGPQLMRPVRASCTPPLLGLISEHADEGLDRFIITRRG